MEKTKNYKAFFTAPVVKAAVKKFTQLTTKAKVKSELFSLEVGDREASWTFDTLEEFLGAYKQSARQAALHSYVDGDKYRLSLHWDHGSTTRVSVRAPSRVEIETIFNIFEEKFAESQLPAEEESYQPPVVFVGQIDGDTPQRAESASDQNPSVRLQGQAIDGIVGARIE